MVTQDSSRPVFGRPGWRRRVEEQHDWDKEFRVVALVVFALILSLVVARADEGAGLPGDDPKDGGGPAVEESAPPSSYVGDIFLPLPGWSSFARMPALPEVLRPLGHSPIVNKPSSAAVAETKPDGAPPPRPAPKAAPPAANTPALIALSPFLQWIKDHPQEAAAAARRQAATEAGTPATAPGVAPGTPDVAGDPYWMPPMIDSSAPTAPTLQAGGNGASAAIYSTPQR